MTTVLILGLLAALQSQTPSCTSPAPPAPKAEKVAGIKSMQDVVSFARLGNGEAAPKALVLPVLVNGADISSVMRESYPQSLREDTVPHPMAMTWICVTEAGTVGSSSLVGTTGVAELDSFAVHLTRAAHFEPAKLDGKPLEIWVPYPVQIPRYGLLGKATPKATPDGPHFTPYTVRPELLNRDDINRELAATYPPALRSQGVGGTVEVWLFLDREGLVTDARLKKTSGYAELDAASLPVARVMKFSPARNRDVVVPVWIAIPIMFKTR